MDYKSRPARTQQPANSPTPQAPASRSAAAVPKPRDKKRIILIVAAASAAFVLITTGCLLLQRAFSSDSAVQGDQYQAVFLTNGQVYFGKLSKTDTNYLHLADIYYLQVQQQDPTSQASEKKEEPKTDQKQQQVALTKLGNELHGPQDSMYIARDQVLFWENLNKDSKVTKAIAEYKQK